MDNATLTLNVSQRILALITEGYSPVDALRAVCGNAVVDRMIDSLYAELRAKVCK